MILELKNIEVEHNMEKTVVIIKPSIPESEYCTETIISRDKFSKIFKRIIRMKWFVIIDKKEWLISEEIAKKHYEEKKDHPLFNDVVKYISSDISLILSIEWEEAILKIRKIALNMREKYIWNRSKLYNLIHSSDSLHESNREHQIHFNEEKQW